MKAKYALFCVLTASLSLLFFFAILLSLDLYYHKKFLMSAGLNYKGYRGEVLGRKEKNEIRIAVLGGSSVFGYGVRYFEALPAQLEKDLQAYSDARGTNKKIKVINLAYNNEGAYAFYYNLKDFSALDYDYVLIYAGYNDLGGGNVTVYRHKNPIFRIFGYMPIIPMLAREKIMVIQSGGQLEKAYLGQKIVFKPNTKDRIKVAILNNFLGVYNNLEENVGKLKKMKNLDFDPERLKKDPFSWYVHFMKKSIDYAMENKKKVIVITQPYINKAHIIEQDAMRAMLDKEYSGNPNLLYVNLGESISLKDETLSFDNMHLTVKGCKTMANIISDKIRDYILPRQPAI